MVNWKTLTDIFNSAQNRLSDSDVLFTTLKDLLSVNLWAVPYLGDLRTINLPLPEDFTEQFSVSRRAATLDRIYKGSTFWNCWSEAMLRMKSRLITNTTAKLWWDLLSEAELSNVEFSQNFDAAAAIFPGSVDFAGSVFLREAWLNYAQFKGPTSFQRTSFSFGANFEGSIFEDEANFTGACFRRTAEFRNVNFKEASLFDQASFVKDAWFRGAFFKGRTSFQKARFGGEAGLGACRYNSSADFSSVAFEDNAGFDGSCFAGNVNFNNARFVRNTFVSETTFKEAVTINGAMFLGNMRLDGIRVVRPELAAHLQELIRSTGIPH